MASNVKVSIDQMADEIMSAMQEYSDMAAKEMKSAVQKSANLVKSEIQANAPVRTGKYKKSWTVKKEESSMALSATVYSSNRYQIAHLLEKGHAKRYGGRVAAIPHIAPAEQAGIEKFEELLTKALGE